MASERQGKQYGLLNLDYETASWSTSALLTRPRLGSLVVRHYTWKFQAPPFFLDVQEGRITFVAAEQVSNNRKNEIDSGSRG